MKKDVDIEEYFSLMASTRLFYDGVIVKDLRNDSEPLSEIFSAECFETLFPHDVEQFCLEEEKKFPENFNPIEAEREFFASVEEDPEISFLDMQEYRIYFKSGTEEAEKIAMEKVCELHEEQPATFKEVLQQGPTQEEGKDPDSFPFGEEKEHKARKR